MPSGGKFAAKSLSHGQPRALWARCGVQGVTPCREPRGLSPSGGLEDESGGNARPFAERFQSAMLICIALRAYGAQSDGAGIQSLRGVPKKKRATVPGPVWLPIVVPMLLISTLPFRCGKRASTSAATALASSMQADSLM